MDSFDLLIVGGGINGTAIARDAAGRGLDVLLVEKDDLAAHTSSASSKLIHGGLRYLEHYDFRLVRELLHERETMLRIAPHIVRPLEFVLPDPPGGRPWWMIRLGLLAYDCLAGRRSQPPALARRAPGRQCLPPAAQARLQARHLLGRLGRRCPAGRHSTRSTPPSAAPRSRPAPSFFPPAATAKPGPQPCPAAAASRPRMIVNAAGPWVAEMLEQRLSTGHRSAVRLIRGSHIVVPRLAEGEHAYILQQPDGRFVFVLPYGAHSLIGTTDVPVARPDEAAISPEEVDYLCDAANAYFTQATAPADRHLVLCRHPLPL